MTFQVVKIAQTQKQSFQLLKPANIHGNKSYEAKTASYDLFPCTFAGFNNSQPPFTIFIGKHKQMKGAQDFCTVLYKLINYYTRVAICS